MAQYTIMGNHNVIAPCPRCNAKVSFESRHQEKPLPFITEEGRDRDGYGGTRHYRLLRCASCGRGAFAVIFVPIAGARQNQVVEEFYPSSRDIAKVPQATPSDIEAELREAELCAAMGAMRAASAMLRSVLEKTLRRNGYTDGSLFQRIDLAAEDAVLTDARRKKAHENVRVLGNDVLHEDYRQIDSNEVEESHHYMQRILEDFYDDRPTIEAILTGKGRLPQQATGTESQGEEV